MAPEKIVGKLKNGSTFSTVPVPNDTELTGLLVENDVQISGRESSR